MTTLKNLSGAVIEEKIESQTSYLTIRDFTGWCAVFRLEVNSIKLWPRIPLDGDWDSLLSLKSRSP